MFIQLSKCLYACSDKYSILPYNILVQFSATFQVSVRILPLLDRPFNPLKVGTIYRNTNEIFTV